MFSYLEEADLSDAINDSEAYMLPFFEPLAENERLSRGRPGRIPKGKPRVTDGTLAGVTRETPKRVVQQIPTGRVVIKSDPKRAEEVSAVLTDDILKNANSGGTPYSKSKNSIKDVCRTGASAAYCFYNRRGDWFGADFRRVYIKDIGFEKGKVSEFDSNIMFMTGWATELDIKATINWQIKLKKNAIDRKEKYQDTWILPALQELLSAGPTDKDNKNKTEEEKRLQGGTQGYFKLVHAFQIGVEAPLYTYAPRIKKVVKKCISKDPRGIIPIHLLVPEEDYANPLGEALISISAGKQNLLDFDMQMYMYSQGLQYSPPVKVWGNIPIGSIRLVPDAAISMGGNRNSGNDIEAMDIGNRAQNNFASNYGLIKSQILNELGTTNDTSISGTSGNPGFSKTSQGVSQLRERLGISDNDLRQSYEVWFGRICETLLNIQFAESKGKKEMDVETSTLKRMKLDKAPTIDYDKETGPIRFTVDASSAQSADNEKENERLVTLLELKAKYGVDPDQKFMLMYNQIVQNSGVDDPEKLMYSDSDLEQATERDQIIQQKAMEALTAPPVQPQPPVAPQMPLDQGLPMPPEQQMPMSQNMPMPQAQPMAPSPTQDSFTPDEMDALQMLTRAGYSQEQQATALVLLRNNTDDDQLMAVLGTPEGARE